MIPDQSVFPLSCVIGIDRLTSLPFQGTYWYHSHFKNQYCDGLRGALIVDDPNDPQKYLYDVDNGEKDVWKGSFTGLRFPPDDTVITLADWYHYLSTEAPPVP
jgi:iron transport multicopper oxidase